MLDGHVRECRETTIMTGWDSLDAGIRADETLDEGMMLAVVQSAL